MIRIVLIAVVLMIGSLIAGLVIAPMYAGEAVRLTTTTETGEGADTYLWVVGDGDQVYIRAANPESGWVSRLRANPRVRLEREGRTRSYQAVPLSDEATRTRVNRLMAEKYGTWDRIDSYLLGHDTSLPIRLVPDQ